MIRASRVAVREQYLQHNGRGAAIPDDEFYNLLSMVDEAVDMLKHGIAQGSLNQNTGRYGMYNVVQLFDWIPNRCRSMTQRSNLPKITSK
jgi:hypothetical protein